MTNSWLWQRVYKDRPVPRQLGNKSHGQRFLVDPARTLTKVRLAVSLQKVFNFIGCQHITGSHQTHPRKVADPGFEKNP